MYITNGNYKKALANGDFAHETYLWLYNLPSLTTLPDMPSATCLWLFNLPGLTVLPDMPCITYLWLYNLPSVLLPARISTTRRVIAMCPRDGYALIQTDDDRFFAGCRKNLSRDDALALWDRNDARARLFTKAILENM